MKHREPLGGPGTLEAKSPACRATDLGLPGYSADLTRLEQEIARARREGGPLPSTVSRPTLNPTLTVVPVEWRGLSARVLGQTAPAPEPGEELVLGWVCPARGPQVRAAEPRDLLALKVVAEELDPRDVAREGGVGVGAIQGALEDAVAEGLVLAPPSRLRRDPGAFPAEPGGGERFRVATAFTLQWHVTQACDLACTHCYDRSSRPPLDLTRGRALLDELYDFCRDRRVRGQVTFTGGNPLLFPGFLELYRGAWERGFPAAILGNPTPRERLEEVLAVARPDFFQVSLEGLEEHNDAVRGAGHFRRTLEFLDVLRDLGVYSMVMLTLTRDNLDQVLPLGELLRGRADVFHFNRLSPVGEGAALALPDPGEYQRFLGAYWAAAAENPVLGVKDNLFNPLLRGRGLEVFGGCTGHGCGAAFNFLSLLADGEVHACRKFPSPVGDLRAQSLAEVYDSPAARQYRRGCGECRGCDLAAACGGCLSAAHGAGLDPFRHRDPFCRYPEAPPLVGQTDQTG